MLPLIEKLLQAFDSEGVIYCHWKSNAFVSLAARGEDDLDLLISHSSRQVFLSILHRLGFKESVIPKGRSLIPGILSYYGYDETTGQLIHVHAHYKLILGQDMTKNYRLPIEAAYLQSAFQGEFFKLPAPEFEFTVFIIRMMLKYSTWNAILGGLGKLSSRERREMEYLEERVSQEQIKQVLMKHFPFLKMELFDDCVRSLHPSCPFLFRSKTARRLQKVLRGCRRRPGTIDVWLQFWRRFVLAVKRRTIGKVSLEKMKSGGMLVAFVGGDGSGKTTMVDEISSWLSPPFVITKIHMGKPSWSRMTVLIRGVLKVGRILGLWPFSKIPYDYYHKDTPSPFPGYPTLIREVCTARDRYLTYVKARKQADKGAFVICDRFPLPQMIFTDGPQIAWMTKSRPNSRIIRFLGNLEKKYYQSIFPPDLLFVLKADPNTAVERKDEENAEYVRARAKEIWDRDWEDLSGHIINVNRSKEDVLHSIKILLWADL